MAQSRHTHRSSRRMLLLMASPCLVAFSLHSNSSFLQSLPATRPDRVKVALRYQTTLNTPVGGQLVECFDDFFEDDEKVSEPNMEAVPESCLNCTGEECVVALEAEQAAAREAAEKAAIDDARLLQAVALTISDEDLRDEKVQDFIIKNGAAETNLVEQYQMLSEAGVY